MASRRSLKMSSMRILPFIASSVRAATCLQISGPLSRASSSIPSIELSVLSQSKQISFNCRSAYFFVLRLNLDLNFTTRPAVSTRRFSPV